jgi:hypothetical protein
MNYQDLYFKYKTKYLNLKNQLGGDSEIEEYMKKIQLEDKEIAKLAIKNFAKNITELDNYAKNINMNVLNKLFVGEKGTRGFLQAFNYWKLAKKKKTINKELFIYSFLVEYGFNRRPGQINDWIKRGVILDDIVDILQEMLKGSTKIIHRYHRALYVAVMANSYDEEGPLYPLDNPILKTSIKFLSQQDIILSDLNDAKQLNTDVEFNSNTVKYKDIFNDYALPIYKSTPTLDITNEHIANLAGLLSFAVLANIDNPTENSFKKFADKIRSFTPEQKSILIDKAARREVIGLENKTNSAFLKTIH